MGREHKWDDGRRWGLISEKKGIVSNRKKKIIKLILEDPSRRLSGFDSVFLSTQSSPLSLHFKQVFINSILSFQSLLGGIKRRQQLKSRRVTSDRKMLFINDQTVNDILFDD